MAVRRFNNPRERGQKSEVIGVPVRMFRAGIPNGALRRHFLTYAQRLNIGLPT